MKREALLAVVLLTAGLSGCIGTDDDAPVDTSSKGAAP